MSRLAIVDRLQTIVVTATLTSAAWIVVGTAYVDRGGGEPAADTGRATPPPAAGETAAQQAAPADRLVIPVLGVARAGLRDTFADRRGGRSHDAIDIMAPAGTPVLAAAPGTIEKLLVSDAGGNTIYVRSTDRRTIYYYAHLERYAAGAQEGQAVTPGQRLGTVGSTGNADPAAPHLHFAVLRVAPTGRWWESGAPVNPYPLLVAE